MKLKLTHSRFRRDEISVVQDGVAVPYEWTGPAEITVDDIYSRATIQIIPKPLWADLRIEIGNAPELRDLPSDILASAIKAAGGPSVYPEIIKAVAGAIMAERERCAKLVEAFRETTVDDRAELAAAIRHPE